VEEQKPHSPVAPPANGHCRWLGSTVAWVGLTVEPLGQVRTLTDN